MDLAQRLVTILSRKGQCFNKALEIVFAVMAVVDGVICVVAAVQASNHTSPLSPLQQLKNAVCTCSFNFLPEHKKLLQKENLHSLLRFYVYQHR